MRVSRGDVWYADMDPVRGHEQAGTRPVLVLSPDEVNSGPSRLIVVLPLTRTPRENPAYIQVVPPDGGIRDVSYIMCDQIRAISTLRLGRRMGRVEADTLERIVEPLRYLIGI